MEIIALTSVDSYMHQYKQYRALDVHMYMYVHTYMYMDNSINIKYMYMDMYYH